MTVATSSPVVLGPGVGSTLCSVVMVFVYDDERMGRPAAVAFFVVAALALPASAQDADVERRARVHFESATEYFDTGRYEEALREFQASYDASPHAELLYNIYLCEERLGAFEAAASAL